MKKTTKELKSDLKKSASEYWHWNTALWNATEANDKQNEIFFNSKMQSCKEEVSKIFTKLKKLGVEGLEWPIA